MRPYGQRMATTPPSDVVEPPASDKRWQTGVILAGAGFVAAFVLVAMIGVTILAIATGGDDEVATPAPGDTGEAGEAVGGQTIVATEFAFTPPITQSGTQVELTLVNEGAAFHNLEIEGVDGFILEVDAGATDSGTIELAAGNYVLWCSVPGHREAGMEGSLIVG